MTVAEFAVIASAIMAGACLQGAIGFGMGLLATPVVALIEPLFVPVVLLVLNAVLTLGIICRERIAFDISGPLWAILGRVPGTILGAVLIAHMSREVLAFTIAGAVLFGVWASLRGWSPHLTRKVLFLAGSVSGIMGTATSLGGPPMALVWQSFSAPNLRAAMSSFLLIGCLMSLTALLVVGLLNTTALVASAGLLPFMLLGFAVSGRLRRLLDVNGIRGMVLAVSALSALFLVGQQLM